jgi:nicotinate-nucleotide pyrophosphorylase (carboxylating)
MFEAFFCGRARELLLQGVDLALAEDGSDLTSLGLFAREDMLRARLVAKEETLVVGLPLIELIFSRLGRSGSEVRIDVDLPEGSLARTGQRVCLLSGPARPILQAERVLLNYICHLSGVANLTSRFVRELQGSRTSLLDTRKTHPGLRYPEKYAVLMGGGRNHRLNLSEMLMLKDNHIDRAGSISQAVAKLRAAYDPCPPIVVECRDVPDVKEAVAARADRVLLDNMAPETIRAALDCIPEGIASEISGGVSLDNISELGALGADYVSVGRLTNSAPNADFSLQIERLDTGSPEKGVSA